MSAKVALSSVVLVCATLLPLTSAALEPRNNVKVSVAVQITPQSDNKAYRYGYTVSNGAGATQNIWRFQVVLASEGLTMTTARPESWGQAQIKPKGEGRTEAAREVVFVRWDADVPARIAPGAQRGGFVIDAPNTLPGIVRYYAEGYAPPPESRRGGIIPGYDDLTLYGPGVVGSTVGPVRVIEPFDAQAFAEYLATLKDEVLTLEWVGDENFARLLDGVLEGTKLTLLARRNEVARQPLEALLTDLAALKPQGITDEGRAVLKYNIEYLVARL